MEDILACQIWVSTGIMDLAYYLKKSVAQNRIVLDCNKTKLGPYNLLL